MTNKNAELFEKLIEILAQENIKPAYGLEQIQKFVSQKDLSEINTLFATLEYKYYGPNIESRLEFANISEKASSAIQPDSGNPNLHLRLALKWDENGWRRAEFKKVFAVEVEGELFVSGSKYES